MMRVLVLLFAMLLVPTLAWARVSGSQREIDAQWRKAGFDGDAQKEFARGAARKLARTGIAASVSPRSGALGGRPFLGTIQVVVRSASQVSKAFELLAPAGTKGIVLSRTGDDLPSAIYLEGGRGRVQFSVESKEQ